MSSAINDALLTHRKYMGYPHFPVEKRSDGIVAT